MVQKAVIMDENQIKRAIARISYEIIERNKGTKDIVIIGIMSGGVHIARRIAEKLRELEGFDGGVGILDITAFRDDEKNVPDSDKTNIDFSIKDKSVVLVDDVIYTGRTARAAIDCLLKQGRPANIQLAAVIDRGHRELPIRPDFVGKNIPTSREELVSVRVPSIDGECGVKIFSK